MSRPKEHTENGEPPQQIVLLRRLFITSELFLSKSKDKEHQRADRQRRPRDIPSGDLPVGRLGFHGIADKERSIPAEELIGKQHGERRDNADQHAAEPAESRSLMGQRGAVRQIEDR